MMESELAGEGEWKGGGLGAAGKLCGHRRINGQSARAAQPLLWWLCKRGETGTVRLALEP